MGMFADLITNAKTFDNTPTEGGQQAHLLQALEELQARTGDPDVPAAFEATDEVQTIAQAESDDGTWILTIRLADGTSFSTAAMAHDLNAAGIIAAIDTASPASVTNGHIVATGGPIGSADVVLTFSGGTVDATNYPAVSVESSLLLAAAPVADPEVVQTTAGQTARNALAILDYFDIISMATPPEQTDAAPTIVAGANPSGIKPWLIRALAREAQFQDSIEGLEEAIAAAT